MSVSPLEDEIGQQAHHHSGKDGAVDGDEVLVKAVADVARRAGVCSGGLSTWAGAQGVVRQREVRDRGDKRRCRGGCGKTGICWRRESTER